MDTSLVCDDNSVDQAISEACGTIKFCNSRVLGGLFVMHANGKWVGRFARSVVLKHLAPSHPSVTHVPPRGTLLHWVTDRRCPLGGQAGIFTCLLRPCHLCTCGEIPLHYQYRLYCQMHHRCKTGRGLSSTFGIYESVVTQGRPQCQPDKWHWARCSTYPVIGAPMLHRQTCHLITWAAPTFLH